MTTHLRPGTHLHFALTPSRPNALMHAVCRTFEGRGEFTVSIPAIYSSAHALALSGAVRKVITCFLGETDPSPRPCGLYRDLRQGHPFEAELWSLLSFQQRLMAGAQGLPYAVTRSLAGTDLVEGKEGDLWAVPDPGA
ncbi:hypothetical protein Pen01_54780 [Phytomonospora endophytica]|nr:hypothetical protein Pen01_54780 [Phytomonospora endophytica]